MFHSHKIVRRISAPARSGGFSLIEILVVIALIGIVATLVIRNVSGGLESGKIKAAKAQIASIGMSVEQFYVDNGSYPEKLEDLASKPGNAANWMGPYGWTMSECKNDLRPGGEFRYTWSKPGGGGITITGVNKEITPPSRIVSTESWGEPWPVSTNTMEFTEVEGQTTLVMTIRYPSKEARDTALGTGMKDGMTTGYERLDEYLGSIA